MTICHETRTVRLVIVDLFCGAGGLSEGAKSAVDRIRSEYPGWTIVVIHIAINCWDIAITTHKNNHPEAIQLCQRIEGVRPRDLLGEHGITTIDLLCAAPECIWWSRARGDAPVNDQRRSSAWSVPTWCSDANVLAILIENVREIQEWGPLDPLTLRPDKKRRGAIFHAWLMAFQAMGYITHHRVLCCADYGDPTTRERWFLLARKDGLSFDFPKATHLSPAKLAQMVDSAKQGGSLFAPDLNLTPWKTARTDVIDWSLKGPSIFERESLGMQPLVENTLNRIEAGLSKFNGINGLPFIVALRHFMGRMPGPDPLIGPPAPPIVMKGGEQFNVEAVQVVFRQHGDGESIDAPTATVCAGGLHLGVAEPSLVKFYGNGTAEDVDDSLDTVTGRDRFGLAEPAILHHRTFDKQVVDSANDPMRTTRGEANTIQIAEPALVNMKGQSDASSIDTGTPTQTACQHLYVSEPVAFLLPHQKFGQVGADSVDSPHRTVTANNGRDNGFAEPVVVPQFSDANAKAAGDTLGTITTIARPGVAEPFMTPGFGEHETQSFRVLSVEIPIGTVAATGHFHVCQAFLIDVNHGNGDEDPSIANGRRAHSIDEPIKTQTASRRGKALVIPVLIRMESGKTRPGYQLVTDEGTFYIEILFRMLQPHELAKAHSFPVTYRFHGNKGDIVKQIGNSVPIATATALAYEQLVPLFREFVGVVTDRTEVVA